MVRGALDAAGIEFIDENGGGWELPGARLRKRHNGSQDPERCGAPEQVTVATRAGGQIKPPE